MNGVLGIFNSRKAVMVLLMFGGMTALLLYGKLDGDTYAMLVGSIKAVWLGAHSAEESAKAKAGAKLIDDVADAAIAKAKPAVPIVADTDPSDGG